MQWQKSWKLLLQLVGHIDGGGAIDLDRAHGQADAVIAIERLPVGVGDGIAVAGQRHQQRRAFERGDWLAITLVGRDPVAEPLGDVGVVEELMLGGASVRGGRLDDRGPGGQAGGNP